MGSKKEEASLAEVLRDWERLKKLERNLRAVLDGEDLLGRIERLRKHRDEWAVLAVRLQLEGKPKRKTKR
jgi:hypothetical protein